jgi:hypothetical protein
MVQPTGYPKRVLLGAAFALLSLCEEGDVRPRVERSIEQLSAGQRLRLAEHLEAAARFLRAGLPHPAAKAVGRLVADWAVARRRGGYAPPPVHPSAKRRRRCRG